MTLYLLWALLKILFNVESKFGELLLAGFRRLYAMYLFHSQGLADNTVIAKVNKMVWDLDRPLEEDCTLELLKFEDEEAQAVSIFYQNLFALGLALN